MNTNSFNIKILYAKPKMLKTYVIVLVTLFTVQLVTSNDVENKVQGNDKPHNLHVGETVPGDIVLERTQITGKRRALRWVEYDYTFPSDGKKYDITLVEATNKLSDSKGGYPTLTSGGPGQDHVTIHFTSRWNKGFDFDVLIHGTEIEN